MRSAGQVSRRGSGFEARVGQGHARMAHVAQAAELWETILAWHDQPFGNYAEASLFGSLKVRARYTRTFRGRSHEASRYSRSSCEWPAFSSSYDLSPPRTQVQKRMRHTTPPLRKARSAKSIRMRGN